MSGVIVLENRVLVSAGAYQTAFTPNSTLQNHSAVFLTHPSSCALDGLIKSYFLPLHGEAHGSLSHQAQHLRCFVSALASGAD